MDQYAVIVDNGGGPNLIYHDVEGEVYTFPTTYRQLLLPGTKVVYQRSGKTDEQPKGLKRLMDDAHYFATATIGKVVMTSDGNLRANIDNFVRFKYGVPFRKPDGEHWETASGQFWRNGVRATKASVYNDIVAASNTPPIPSSVSKKGLGIRSTKVLTVGISSKPFARGRFQLVTAKDGYYLKVMSDGIYYQLVKKLLPDYCVGALQALCSTSGISFLLRHNVADVGTLDIIDHGVQFCSKINEKGIPLRIML